MSSGSPFRVVALAALSVLVVGVFVWAESPNAVTDSPFQSRLLEIAKEYESYGRVDDQTRWAPPMCAPMRTSRVESASEARFSTSDDNGTHGQKLYFLFAKNRFQYVALSIPQNSTPVSVGQVVVKESWKPELVPTDTKLAPVQVAATDAENANLPSSARASYIPFARQGDQLFHAAEKAALFIMYKMDPETPGTDEGWVYGTTTADGKTILTAGRVESCMECHKSAPHDRLFGTKDIYGK